MKRNRTRLAVLVLLVCAILAYIRWNPLTNVHPFEVHHPNCLNNLHEIGLSLYAWSLDTGGRFPWNVSTNEGGSMEFCARDASGFDRNAARHFEVMSNELSVPLLLICPKDRSAKAASHFRALLPQNVTYRLRTGPNIDRSHPKEVVAVCPMDGNTLYCDGTVVPAAVSAAPSRDSDEVLAGPAPAGPTCVRNMREIAIAFITWALDHNGQFPFNVPTNQGGTLELCVRDSAGFDSNAFLHFRAIATNATVPAMLVCPTDRTRLPAAGFATLQPSNISYLLRSGPNLAPTNSAEILARCPLDGTTLYCNGSVRTKHRPHD